MPVVAAARLESYVRYASFHRCKVTVAGEVLCISRVRLSLGPDRKVNCLHRCVGISQNNFQRPAEPLCLCKSDFFLQQCRQGPQFGIANAHVPGSGDVGDQLRLASRQGGDSADSNNLAVGETQVVTGKNITEQVSLEVIVRSRDKTVVERLSRQLSLYGRSLFQCIIIGRKRIGLFSGLVLDSCRSPLGQDPLKGPKGIQRAGETGVGIKM